MRAAYGTSWYPGKYLAVIEYVDVLIIAAPTPAVVDNRITAAVHLQGTCDKMLQHRAS